MQRFGLPFRAPAKNAGAARIFSPIGINNDGGVIIEADVGAVVATVS